MRELDRVVRVGDIDDPPAVVVAVEREVALEGDVGIDVPHAVGLAFEGGRVGAMAERLDVLRVRARGVVGPRGRRKGEHGRPEQAEEDWTEDLAHGSSRKSPTMPQVRQHARPPPSNRRRMAYLRR
jgi:hypothetical protein